MAKISSAQGEDAGPATTRTTRKRGPSVEPAETVRPARANRQTRSRSVESNEPARPTSSRRNLHVDNKAELTSSQRTRRKLEIVSAAAPKLSTVEENESPDEATQQAQLESQLQAEPAGAPQDDIQDQDNDRRRVSQMSNLSAISGTTAKTSFSQDELAQMDPDIMIDVLPDLAIASENLAALLLPQGINTSPEVFKEIRSAGSRHNKLYDKRMKSIQVHKTDFGSEEYIRPHLILRALLGTDDIRDVPTSAWRPDNIIYKINLVQMLSTLLISCDLGNVGTQPIDALARLENVLAGTIAGPDYSRDALEFWLTLAAHLAVAMLEEESKANHNFNSHDIINSVFYDDGQFRQIDALHLNTLPGPAREVALGLVDKLANELKEPFKSSGSGTAATIGKLKTKFGWDELKSHALRYYEARSADLDDRIATAGGLKLILAGLSEEVQRMQTNRLIEETREQVKSSARPRKSMDGKGGTGGAAILRRIGKRVSHKATEPATMEPLPVMAEPIENEKIQDTGSRTEAPSPPVPTAPRDMEVPVVLPARRMLDPQPDARRVSTSFEDETQPLAQVQRFKIPASKSKPTTLSQKKRTVRQVEEEDDDIPDPTQDAGFETGRRDFADADQRRKELAAASTRHITTSSTPVREPATHALNSASLSPRPSQPKRARVNPPSPRLNPGSAFPDPLPGPDISDGEIPSSSLYARAKVEAKLNRITATQSRQPRVRVPWTDEEEGAMIELIEQYGGEGVSYAALKKIDDQDGKQLHRRTPEDMRFKARNMKTTLLLAGGILPENWEHVVLSKKEIDKIRDRGVEYDQEQIRRRAMSMDLGE